MSDEENRTFGITSGNGITNDLLNVPILAKEFIQALNSLRFDMQPIFREIIERLKHTLEKESTIFNFPFISNAIDLISEKNIVQFISYFNNWSSTISFLPELCYKPELSQEVFMRHGRDLLAEDLSRNKKKFEDFKANIPSDQYAIFRIAKINLTNVKEIFIFLIMQELMLPIYEHTPKIRQFIKDKIIDHDELGESFDKIDVEKEFENRQRRRDEAPFVIKVKTQKVVDLIKDISDLDRSSDMESNDKPTDALSDKGPSPSPKNRPSIKLEIPQGSPMFKSPFEILRLGEAQESMISLLDRAYESIFISFVPENVFLRQKQINYLNRKSNAQTFNTDEM